MSVGSSTLSGAASGASLGSVAGPWGTAIGGVVGAGAGLISGLSQKKKRDAAAKAASQRPTYTIPKEIYENKAMYEAMAKDSRLPGQSQIQKQIGQTESRSLNASQKAAGSSADALAAVGGIQQNTLDQYGQLALMGAQNQNQNKSLLAQARGDVADYKQQAFDYNKNQPWQIAYEYNQKLQDQNRLDNQNIVNDVQALGASAGSAVDKYGRRIKPKPTYSKFTPGTTDSGSLYNINPGYSNLG